MNASGSRFAAHHSSLPSTDGIGEDEPKRSILYQEYLSRQPRKNDHERGKYKEVHLRNPKGSENPSLDRLVNIYAKSPVPNIKKLHDNSLLLDLKKLERPRDHRRFESPSVKLPKINGLPSIHSRDYSLAKSI